MSSPISRENFLSYLPGSPSTPPRLTRPQECASPTKRKVSSVLNYSPPPKSQQIQDVVDRSMPTFHEIGSISRFSSYSSTTSEPFFSPSILGRVHSEQERSPDDSAFSSLSHLRRSLSDSHSSTEPLTPLRRPALQVLQSTPNTFFYNDFSSNEPKTPPARADRENFFTPPPVSPIAATALDDMGTPPASTPSAKQQIFSTSVLDAPVKAMRGRKLSSFEETALATIESLSITRAGIHFSIFPLSGMKGNYSQIYTIKEKEPSIVEGLSNKEVLVKMFQKKTFELRGNLVIKEYIPNMLWQYNELRTANLNIATIFNADTVLSDGYLLVRRLQPFVLPWDNNTQELELAAHANTLEQLSVFIRYALGSKSDLPLDISKDNFCLDEHNNVTLIDFREEKEDLGDGYPFHLVAKKAFESLSNGNRHVYNYFKELTRNYSDLYSSL